MIRSHSSILLILAMVLLSQALALDCSGIAHSNGTDPDSPSTCLCQQDYYWSNERCVSIEEYFTYLDVAQHNLDLGAASDCEDDQFFASGTCFECDSESPNCLQCTVADNSTSMNMTGGNMTGGNTTANISIENAVITCTMCSDFSFLQNGSCVLCSEEIANCFECSNGTLCDVCETGYVVSGSSCVAEPQCLVDNCQLCDFNNSNVCTTCLGNYTLTTDNTTGISTCAEPTCLGDLVFSGLVCACPEGFYASGNSCVRCISLCKSCTNGTSCDVAIGGYVVVIIGGSPVIQTCATSTGDANCLICLGSVCLFCSRGYVPFGGVCTRFAIGFRGFFLNAFGVRAFCPRGVLGGLNASFATSCFRGYALFNGGCFRCGRGCRECTYNSATQSTVCTKGAPGWALLTGGGIATCPANCQSCSRASFCTTCKSGFAAVNGVCQACSNGCNFCTEADTCLEGQCGAGYGYTTEEVDEVDVGRCSQCIAGCGKCDADILACEACADGLYNSGSSSEIECTTCPTGCATCTSATECQSCSYGYELSGNICVESCAFPCTECSSSNNSVCTACFGGYRLVESSCVEFFDCSPNCNACPRGYFLDVSNRACINCTFSASNCIACSDTNISECAECASGYYIDENLTCQACPTGCAICENEATCLQASTGYYLISQVTGQVGTCDSDCLTCSGTADTCLTCASGYFLRGSYCQTNRRVRYGLVLGGFGYTLFLFKLIFFFWIGRFALRIRRRRRRCGFFRVFQSSVGIDGDVSISPDESAESVLASIQSGVAEGDIGGLEVESSSVSSVNFGAQQEDSNLGLILGVSIPVGLLLIAAVIGAIYKIKKGDSYQTKDEEIENLSEEKFGKDHAYL